MSPPALLAVALSLAPLPGEEGISLVHPASGLEVRGAATGSWDLSGPFDDWRLEHRFHSIGRVCEPMRAMPAGDGWSRTGERAEIPRGSAIEWLEVRADGIEQGIDILERPAGAADAAVVVTAQVAGLSPRADSDDRLTWRDAEGDVVLTSHALVVLDARGRRLSARFEAGDGELSVVFDDRGAAWPVRVDPVFAVPRATIDGRQEDAHFGRALDLRGDVDSDGLADLLAGARDEDFQGADAGRVYLHRGSASGCQPVPAWISHGRPGERLGASVAHLGDINGDGFGDVAAGGPGGAIVRAWYGESTGLRAPASWTFASDQADGDLGRVVAAAGDLNADGFADLAVGEPLFDGTAGADAGRVLFFHGSAAGLAATPDGVVEGLVAGAGFGYAISTAGDVSGDGFDDVLVGSSLGGACMTMAGEATLLRGSSTGIEAVAAWHAAEGQPGECFGFSVAGVGDLDGDGLREVAIGAPRHDGIGEDAGRVAVFSGIAGGIAATPSWILSGESGEWFGTALGRDADFELDGHADVVASAPQATGALDAEGVEGAGRIAVFNGSPSGPLMRPSAEVRAEVAGDELGFAVSSGGDVDGDGFQDLAIGCWRHDVGASLDGGRAVVYQGSPTGLALARPWMRAWVDPGVMLFSAVTGAGDVNGDAFDDMLISRQVGRDQEAQVELFLGGAAGLGADPAWTTRPPNQPSCCFGSVLLGAGDIDADGYDDVVLGSPRGHDFDGEIHVFHGSASGLPGAPSYSIVSPIHDAYGGGEFGSTLGAGDVNGDGYADVIVGTGGSYVGYPGHASAFLGGPTGLERTPSWFQRAHYPQENFGSAVAGVGDVDGDGFDDVLLGERACGQQGTARLYRGSPSGLGPVPDWSMAGERADEAFSADVGAAGDLNGDGLADFVVGSDHWTNGYLEQGRVRIFLGGSFRPTEAATLEGNGNYARLSSARGIGDVDGDGFDDLLVSGSGAIHTRCNERWAEPEDGAYVAIHLGRPYGVDPEPIWLARSDEARSAFGAAVAALGDIDANGIADYAVAAPRIQWPNDGGASHVLVYSGWGAGVAPGAAPVECHEPSALDLRPGARPLGVEVSDAGLHLSWEPLAVGTASVQGLELGELRASRGTSPLGVIACGVAGSSLDIPTPAGDWAFVVRGECGLRPASGGRMSDGRERSLEDCP